VEGTSHGTHAPQHPTGNTAHGAGAASGVAADEALRRLMLDAAGMSSAELN